MESTALTVMNSTEQENLFDRFCEWTAEWCFENEVPYEDSVVVTFSRNLNEGNFNQLWQECCNYLQFG